MSKHPIVFFVFNRPRETRIVFEIIRTSKPSKLFLVADGAREGLQDQERCLEVRKIISDIDWDCQIFRNYSDINLGCKLRVSSGLDWVFSQVETAIVLEDDCLPTTSFFDFCDQLLDYYQDDDRVFSISGTTFQPESRKFSNSYYFSKYPNIWGWATWRRAWKFYDVDMKLWKSVDKENYLSSLLPDWQTRLYWKQKFQKLYQQEIDTWDFQWIFASFIQNGLHVLPAHNLVSNIGFGQEATHTKKESKLSRRKTFELEFPLQHPEFIIRDAQADSFTDQYVYQCQLYQRILNRISRLRS
jgi:hypothetical protein